MTLLVALRGSNGMVLACDSRGTFGDPRGVTAQNDSMRKLYKASRYVGIMIAGSGELGSTIMNEVQDQLQENAGVSAIQSTLGTFVRQKYPGFAVQQVPGVPAPVRPDLALVYCWL